MELSLEVVVLVQEVLGHQDHHQEAPLVLLVEAAPHLVEATVADANSEAALESVIPLPFTPIRTTHLDSFSVMAMVEPFVNNVMA